MTDSPDDILTHSTGELSAQNAAPSVRPKRARRQWLPWATWAGLTVCAGLYLSGQLFAKGTSRRVFLPGATTDGHYQLEVSCESCHTNAFTSADQMQAACESCHAEELDAVNDSHPKSKFTDPRNADRVAQLDARYCVTCHVEHRPGATGAMGVTLPDDYCYRCHAEIADERESHRGMAFDSCAATGCHNFHDNRALYEDFLDKHLDEPYLRSETVVQALTPILEREPSLEKGPALATTEQDAPQEQRLEGVELADWAASDHARRGINCRTCHEAEGEFEVEVQADKCSGCHSQEYAGWQQGKHGLRTAHVLAPMSVKSARQPMKATSHDELLSCTSCHGAHDFNPQTASVDACLKCHDDEHSNNYQTSGHARLFRDELLGVAAAGAGVSCATCHLPRTSTGNGSVIVQHNQNDNLRPREKMIRGVCNECHGLGFAIDALASEELIRLNFSKAPAEHVGSLDMVKARSGR